MAGYGSGTSQVGPAGLLAKACRHPKAVETDQLLVHGFGEHVVMKGSRGDVVSEIHASNVALDDGQITYYNPRGQKLRQGRW